jgi:hypothetical protein
MLKVYCVLAYFGFVYWFDLIKKMLTLKCSIVCSLETWMIDKTSFMHALALVSDVEQLNRFQPVFLLSLILTFSLESHPFFQIVQYTQSRKTLYVCTTFNREKYFSPVARAWLSVCSFLVPYLIFLINIALASESNSLIPCNICSPDLSFMHIFLSYTLLLDCSFVRHSETSFSPRLSRSSSLSFSLFWGLTKSFGVHWYPSP